MKLCFSTLGCNDWTLREACAAAKDLAIGGIEIRRLENEKHAPSFKCFTGERLAESAALLREKGVQIPLLASRAVFGARTAYDATRQAAREYFELAKKLGVPFVKAALTDRPTELSYDEDAALENARALCDAAAEYGVSLLVTTNGAFSDTALLADFISKARRDNLFVLWDVHYTVRLRGEAPEQTVKNLGRLIKFVQLKDSAVQDGGVVYKLTGDGDLPIKAAARALAGIGYDGFYSCEWKKNWGEEFVSPGIVLARFCAYMARLEKEI